jgi:hypothetical protein
LTRSAANSLVLHRNPDFKLGPYPQATFCFAPALLPYNGAMSEGLAKRHQFRFGLRRLFALVTIIAVLTAWAISNWRIEHERREFLGVAGAVNGNVRTVQGYRFDWDRKSIKWWLFGERRVTFMNLYPGTYDDAYLMRVRSLFPEAEIVSSSDPNVDPTKISD